MKKTSLSSIVLTLFVSIGLDAATLINESSIERLRSLPYEEYDSGYGLWDSADLELFISRDGNFS
ncbi:MAG TPA: hypothetical protein QF540_07585, partial [Gammaproteobacteria bacterium]|nr:hypothetical protein [Gammaproteobacteria bacterium]